MDSPLSLIVANLIMIDLENWVLSDIQYHIPFYYVDNIVLCLPSSKIDSILEKFNSFYSQFGIGW